MALRAHLLPRRPARHRLGQLFSTDREEFIAGLIAVAVPVQGVDGVSRAAIAVHAPVARMALADAVAQLPALRAAAARMRALR